MEGDEIPWCRAEQTILARLRRQTDAIEADLLGGRRRDLPAQRGREQLAAQADPEHRSLLLDAPPQQADLVAQMRQPVLLVCAHSAPEDDQRVALLGHRFAREGADDARVSQEGSQAARAFAWLVLHDDEHPGGEYIARFSRVTAAGTCA